MEYETFFDLLDHGEPIRVLARISALKTQEGGRKGPFGTRYRPNHNFGAEDNRVFYIGQVEVPDGVLVHPGEVVDLRVTFLSGRGLLELLRVGRTWRIQEGSRCVAMGTVLALLDED